MKTLLPLIALLFIFSGFRFDVSAQNNGDAILGYWVTEETKSIVEVYKKDDGLYYAKIVWLKEPNGEDGKPKLDKENPDEKLKTRPLIGMEFMIGFAYDADDNEWEGKSLYDPESGNTYSGYLQLKNKDLIHLRGYVGISLLGRTSQWVRKPEKKN